MEQRAGRPLADPCELPVFGVKLQLCLIYRPLCLGPNLQRLTQRTHNGSHTGDSCSVCVFAIFLFSVSSQLVSSFRGSYIRAGLTSLLSLFLSVTVTELTLDPPKSTFVDHDGRGGTTGSVRFQTGPRNDAFFGLTSDDSYPLFNPSN